MRVWSAVPVNEDLMREQPAVMRRLIRTALVTELRSHGYRVGPIRFLVDPRERHGFDEFPPAAGIQTGYPTHIIAAVADVDSEQRRSDEVQ